MRDAGIWKTSLVPIDRDKVGRLYVQQSKFEAGHVCFLRGASFSPILEAELLAFPQAQYDDRIDQLSSSL